MLDAAIGEVLDLQADIPAMRRHIANTNVVAELPMR